MLKKFWSAMTKRYNEHECNIFILRIIGNWIYWVRGVYCIDHIEAYEKKDCFETEI